MSSITTTVSTAYHLFSRSVSYYKIKKSVVIKRKKDTIDNYKIN